jgi:hypothetical protein
MKTSKDWKKVSQTSDKIRHLSLPIDLYVSSFFHTRLIYYKCIKVQSIFNRWTHLVSNVKHFDVRYAANISHVLLCVYKLIQLTNMSMCHCDFHDNEGHPEMN